MEKEQKKIDYNVLGQCTDSTFGRSSTPSGASQSIKFKMLGEYKIEVRYKAIVNLVNDCEMIDLKKRYTTEANSVINSSLKNVKEYYKEHTENSIKFKQLSESDSFDIIDLNIYNRKRTAYFKKIVVYEMS